MYVQNHSILFMGFLLNQYEITLSFLTSLDLKFMLLDIGTVTPGCFMDFCWLEYISYLLALK